VNTDPLRRRAIIALVLVNLLWGISFPAMKAINMVMEPSTAGTSDLAERSQIDLRRGLAEIVGERGGKDGPQSLSMASFNHHVLTASFLTCVRFSVSIALLFITVPRLFYGMTRSHWLMGLGTGLAFAPGLIMQNVGLNYVPASRSGFLTSLTVVTTPLVMIVVERRFPRRLVLVGVVVGLIGTAILTKLIEIDGLGVRVADDALSQLGPGDWLTIGAAFIFTAQILLIDRFSRRMPAGRLTPGMFVAALGVGAAVFGIGQLFQPDSPDSRSWVALLIDLRFITIVLVLSVFCTVLAFHWMNKYQAHVTPAQAALIYTTEPIFATIWAMILPNLISRLFEIGYPSERPGRELVIGGLFIVLGNALALWPRPEQGGHS
jgi:drug/metabolite transporter (DMT)-like permease